MAIKVFDGTDNTFSTNGEIVLNPTRAIVHKEDNGSFYLDLETPLTQETKYVAPEEGSSATINGSGQIQNVDSTKESELVSLKGDTYQYTTTGKNLYNLSGGTNVNTTSTINNDTLTLTSTGSWARYEETINVVANQGYTFKVVFSNNTGKVKINLFDGATDIGGPTSSTSSSGTFTIPFTPQNTTIKIQMYCNFTGDNVSKTTTFSQVQLEKGSATSYEPYTNGASPNPDYPQSINVVSGLQEVEIKGKNLFDYTKNILNNANFGSGTFVNDNTCKLSYIECKPNTTYTISRINPTTTRFFICTTEEEPQIGVAYSQQKTYYENTTKSITLTTNSTAKYIVIRFIYNEVNDYETYAKTIQIEKGSTATTYEPYKVKTYDINLGKNLLDYSDTTKYKTISGVGTTLSTIDNGIRATQSQSGTYKYGVYVFDIGTLKGETLTISATMTASASNNGSIRVYGWTGNAINTQITLTNGTFTIPSDFAYNQIGILFYSNTGGTGNVGDYVDYTNIQLEKGSKATTYSKYFEPIFLGEIGTYQDKIFKGKGTNIIGLDTQQYKVDLKVGDKISMTNNTSSALQVNLYTNYGDTTRNDYWSVGANGRRTITIAYDTKAIAWSSTPNGLAFGNYGDTFLPYEPYGAKDKWLLHKEIRHLSLPIANMNNGEDYPGWNNVEQLKIDYPNMNASFITAGANYISNVNQQPSSGSDYIGMNTTNSREILYFMKSMFGLTQTQWKTNYPNLVFDIYYTLQAPTTEEITNSELVSQLNAIELIGGLNNISLSSEYLTGPMELKYNFVSGGETTAKYIDYLQANNILVANTPQGNQAFRISNVERTRSKIRLKANHIFYDTQNYVIKDSYVVEKNCNQALDHLNDATDNESPFTMTSDITTLNSYRCVRKSLYEAIQVVLERWGGHLVRDNFDIKVMNSIGNDNGVVVRYGKNLKNISATYNWDAVATKLMPVGKDGLLLPEEYLYASVQYDIPYTKVISFDQNNIVEDDYADADAYQQALVDDLRQKGMEYLASNSIPMVNYTLNANLERITDIGDTIEVIDERLGINLLTNLISYEYNCILDKYTQVQFGNFTPKLQNLMETIASNTEKAIEENNGVIQITLENELTEATDRIWGVLGNSYVIYEGDKILVVDELPKENAHNVIMINSGGIGFSQTGINGTFQSAWTIDNTLNMENINVINLTADLIKGGILKLGSNLNQYGQIEIYNEANNLIAELNKNGFKMYGTDGSYVLMNTQVGFAGYDRNDNKIYWADGDAFHMKKSEVEEEITLCGKMRYIPIHLTDTYNVEHNGIGLVSVLGGGN